MKLLKNFRDKSLPGTLITANRINYKISRFWNLINQRCQVSKNFQKFQEFLSNEFQ